MEIVNGLVRVSREHMFSTIIPNKKILVLQPNCDIHSQLRMYHGEDYTNITYIYSEEDIKKVSNTNFDYVLSHAYWTGGHQQFSDNIPYSFDLFEKYNVTCTTLVIDELGEGASIVDETKITFEINKIHLHLKAKYIKWIAPFEDYSFLEKKYPWVSFFKSKLSAPRFFCNKVYAGNIISGHIKLENDKAVFDDGDDWGNHLVAGLVWKPELKSKLFMCLNNEARPHRVMIVDELKKEKLIDKGHVSLVKYKGEKVRLHNKKTNENLILDTDIDKLLLPWEENSELDNHRFALQTKVAEESYIDVVTESSTGPWPFRTEKCLKPFYNLQFPIIFGHQGIVSYLREVGFDMFDDIINHEYDDISNHVDYIESDMDDDSQQQCAYNDSIRVPILIKELKRLSEVDIQKIYKDCKDRLIRNQELVWKLVIEDNKILHEVAEFAFGTDIYYRETPNQYLEKIYLNK